MPLVNGVYRPLTEYQRQGIFRQSLQIIRGQLGAQAQGHGGGVDELHITTRAIERYLGGAQVVPADRGQILQIIRQAERSHDTAAEIEGRDRAVPLAELNIDPTLGPGGPRVRYRVVVVAETTDGDHSELLVTVDGDRPLSYDEIQQRAFDAARQADPLRTRGYNIQDFGGQGVALEAVVVGAGKRR